MGSVTITREKAAWRDRARAYVVKINGVAAGSLKPGEMAVIPLEPGLHRVRVDLDWCSSPELSLSGAEEHALRCKAGGSALRAAFDTIFRPNKYISLEQD